MAKVKDSITPEGKKFFAAIEKLKNLECRVGFQQGAATSEDGVDYCDIAMFNELGTAGTPSRPFMRNSVDNNAEKISAFVKAKLQELVKGNKSADAILREIGLFQKDLIQESIKNGNFTPNAPSTIKKKGSDKPLIDTGRMRQSVDFVIQKKGG